MSNKIVHPDVGTVRFFLIVLVSAMIGLLIFASVNFLPSLSNSSRLILLAILAIAVFSLEPLLKRRDVAANYERSSRKYFLPVLFGLAIGALTFAMWSVLGS